MYDPDCIPCRAPDEMTATKTQEYIHRRRCRTTQAGNAAGSSSFVHRKSLAARLPAWSNHFRMNRISYTSTKPMGDGQGKMRDYRQ